MGLLSLASRSEIDEDVAKDKSLTQRFYQEMVTRLVPNDAGGSL